jgi:hypothetical protein
MIGGEHKNGVVALYHQLAVLDCWCAFIARILLLTVECVPYIYFFYTVRYTIWLMIYSKVTQNMKNQPKKRSRKSIIEGDTRVRRRWWWARRVCWWGQPWEVVIRPWQHEKCSDEPWTTPRTWAEKGPRSIFRFCRGRSSLTSEVMSAQEW